MIKNYVLDGDELEETVSPTKSKPKKATYEANPSGCDTIIKRTSLSGRETYLVLIPSQRQFYIKSGGHNTLLDSSDESVKALQSFLRDIPQLNPLIPWLSFVPKKKAEIMLLFTVLEDDNIIELIKKNVVNIDLLIQKSASWISNRNMKNLRDLHKATDYKLLRFFIEESLKHDENLNEKSFMANLFEINGSDKYKRMYINLLLIKEYFSIDNAKDYYLDFLASNVDTLPNISLLVGANAVKAAYHKYGTYSNGYYYVNLNQRATPTIFNYKAFKEYSLHESEIQGFALDVQGFIDVWFDTISMQVDLYGKIKDKYPLNLLSYHQELSYKISIIAEKINEKQFNIAVENMDKFEWKNKDYEIIAPKTRQELIDEGMKLSNCLSSYVRKVAFGDCYIFFLRKTQDVEQSYIAIEVRLGEEYSLGQVKGKYDSNPTPEDKQVIDDWFYNSFKNIA